MRDYCLECGHGTIRCRERERLGQQLWEDQESALADYKYELAHEEALHEETRRELERMRWTWVHGDDYKRVLAERDTERACRQMFERQLEDVRVNRDHWEASAKMHSESATNWHAKFKAAESRLALAEERMTRVLDKVETALLVCVEPDHKCRPCPDRTKTLVEAYEIGSAYDSTTAPKEGE